SRSLRISDTSSSEIYTLSLHDALPICVYRLIERHSQAVRGVKGGKFDAAAASRKEKALLRKVHQTLRRVTSDFESRWHFNSAIADRKSTRLNSSHLVISYAVFCLKKKT